MKTRELVNFVADILDRRPGTVSDHVVDLQSGGLVRKGSRGRYSGAQLTETDGINALLASGLDYPRGESICSCVQHLRTARLAFATFCPLEPASMEDKMRASFEFVRGLSVGPLSNLGLALDGIVRDMRTGALAEWASGAEIDVTVDFHNTDRHVILTIDRPVSNKAAVFSFVGTPGKPTATERIVRFHKPVFQGLSNALGPPEKAIPPTP